MAHRLIFTSSSRALTGSRTGFCTVARSRSMSEKLANIVERCGTYDSEKMSKHPIFSHRTVYFANTFYHVLSRISDAGADYTNRSNYLAEHIVLSPEECALLPTPAQFLLDKTDWLGSWQGEPRFIDEVKIEPAKPRFEPPAKNWESAFGDAAKAALLLESSPAIFASAGDGEALLKLFAESASLCPQRLKAWDYTFTTALQHGESPADFSWKAEINPGLEHVKATENAINLIAKSAPPAPESSAAKYAKTGTISNRERFGLKVASAQDLKPKIYIARVEKKGPDKKVLLLIALSAAVTILALLAAIFAMSSGSESGGNSSFTPAEAHANFGSASAPQTAREIYEDLRIKISEKIRENRWSEALQLWDASIAKDYNPDARARILQEIASRADSLMDEAQNLLKNPKSDLDEPRAVRLMHAARDALEIGDLPKRDERLNRWKTIEKEIKKL